MIVRLTNPDYTSEDIDSLCKRIIPEYMRLPFVLSIRFLSGTSIGEFCVGKVKPINDRNEISNAKDRFVKRFYWMNKPPNLVYIPLILIAAIPFLLSVVTYSVLYKRIDLKLLKNYLDYTLPDTVQELNQIEAEFFRMIDFFPLSRINSRKAAEIFREKRQLITLTTKKNTLNVQIIKNIQEVFITNVVVNNYFFPSRIEINQFSSPSPLKSIRLFQYNGTVVELVNLSELLARYKFIDRNHCFRFQSFFKVLIDKKKSEDLKPVQWFGGANELIFLFITLYEYRIIPRDEMNRIASKVESNFFDSKGTYMKNLGTPKNRYDDSKLTPEKYAKEHSDSRYMDLYLIIKSVYPQYVIVK